MDDRWAAITEWAQHASEFRPLKAYAISQDGIGLEPLDCAVVYVALDDNRGLTISLAERIDGEGLAVCSLPPGRFEAEEPSAEPESPHPAPSNPYVIVIRSGSR